MKPADASETPSGEPQNLQEIADLSGEDAAQESGRLAALKGSVAAWNNWRQENPELSPNLKGVILNGVDLKGINLAGADLSGADLMGANLSGADLGGAILEEADLKGADLTNANLKKAKLEAAKFIEATIKTADFTDADLTNADLSRTGQYLPCALVHSQALGDRQFARHLDRALQQNRVERLGGETPWSTEEDLLKVFHEGEIHQNNRYLLTLSKNNVNSPLTQKLIHAAVQVEKKRGQYSIIPVAIDDSFAGFERGWQFLILRRSNSLDFTRWKSSAHFDEVLDQLLSSLRGPNFNPTLPPIEDEGKRARKKEREGHGMRVLKSIADYNRRHADSD